MPSLKTLVIQKTKKTVWFKNGLDIITYNAECITVTDLFQVWNAVSQSYVNNRLTTNSFDANGTVNKQKVQIWDDVKHVWVNSFRSLYVFSSDQLHFTNTGQEWLASAWHNNYRVLVEYNVDGTTKASEFDISDGTNWLPQARSLYSYDAAQRTTDFLNQAYANNEWVNTSRTSFDYSGKGLSFSYYWDSFNNQWVKSQRSFNKYVPNTALTTKQLYQTYTGIEWDNQARYETSYNADNMATKNNGQFWDLALKNWYNGFRVSLDYYDDGSQQFFSFESWDVSTNTWSWGYRTKITNNACGVALEFTPPVEVSDNKTGIANANRLGLKPSVQNKSNSNNINRQYNMQMSNGKTSAYDFTYHSGQKQFAFQLVLKPIVKQQVSKSAVSSNIMQQSNSNILISPNPAKNYFTLNLTGYKTQGNVMLKLTDVSGKNIMQQRVQAGSVQNINLPHLQKGLYIVTIISGKNINTQKLMVE
ncbi:hypothetical protein BH11BAC6_BH11BAC6_14530 [soil metagenome]